MRSTLTDDELATHIYQSGDQVLYAWLQAADVKGYNRTAEIIRVLPFGAYEIRDDHQETHIVGWDDIAPLSSKQQEEKHPS